MVAAGVIRTHTNHAFEPRLLAIAGGLRRLSGEHAPDTAAVEGGVFAANVKTALKLAHVRGVALLAFFFSSRRRHTRSVSAFLLNRSSDLTAPKGTKNGF